MKAYIKLLLILIIYFWNTQVFGAWSWDITPLPKNASVQHSWINFIELRNTRLDRHNKERKELGLTLYTWSESLDQTAQNRANTLATINKTTHKRKQSDKYYNYNNIKNRFADQWVNFPKEKSGIANFSENLAWNVYKCKKPDCTQELIKGIKKGFNFFMSEKGKGYKPHYNAIASKHFTQIGMGVATTWGKYFIVTHYATKVQ